MHSLRGIRVSMMHQQTTCQLLTSTAPMHHDQSRTPSPMPSHGLGADLVLTFAPVWWRKSVYWGIHTQVQTHSYLDQRSAGATV